MMASQEERDKRKSRFTEAQTVAILREADKQEPGCLKLPEARHQRANNLQLAAALRSDERGRGQAAAAARTGERSFEEALAERDLLEVDHEGDQRNGERTRPPATGRVRQAARSVGTEGGRRDQRLHYKSHALMPGTGGDEHSLGALSKIRLPAHPGLS